MHITDDCILFGGNNSGKEQNSAQISAGKHQSNSLNIIGMSSGTSSSNRRIDCWAEGGFNVKGNAIIGESGETLKIGNVGHSGWAGIAHMSRANGSDYALIQHSNGTTLLNSKAGQLLHFRQGNSDKMVIKNGNVGIGTADPQAKLDVRGGTNIHGEINIYENTNRARLKTYLNGLQLYLDKSSHGNGRGLLWDGDTNWDSSSDRCLKTNIENEKNILERLVKLDVKNYNWKDDPDRKPKLIGFIAQDVQPLFPSLVKKQIDEDTKESTLTLGYTNFGVLAVGAIKELKIKVDNALRAQQAEMDALKAKLAQLTAKQNDQSF